MLLTRVTAGSTGDVASDLNFTFPDIDNVSLSLVDKGCQQC